MIGVYDYTVIATYLATVFGLCGMLQAIEGHPLAAIFCLLAAGLLEHFWEQVPLGVITRPAGLGRGMQGEFESQTLPSCL